MATLIPYAQIADWLADSALQRPGSVRLRYDTLLDLMRHVLVCVPVEQAWYLARSPGLAQAIAEGSVASPSHHYIAHGYFEHRQPRPPAEASLPMPFRVVQGMLTVSPARGHLRVDISEALFIDIISGLLEGVPIDETAYLRQNPAIAAAVARGEVASGARHFRRHGYFEGRPCPLANPHP